MFFHLREKSGKAAIQALLYLVVIILRLSVEPPWQQKKWTKDYTTINDQHCLINDQHCLINAISSSRRGFLPPDRRVVV